MIRQVTARNAKANAGLLDEMYRARKRLFKDRLGWTVTVDSEGREIDRYDTLTPLYLISLDEGGAPPGFAAPAAHHRRDDVAGLFHRHF